MTVKTCDKADFQFDSDSLVLSAMEYFKKNGTDTVRAEAFYYAGRVARMLGDSPQALDYMQNALNCLDDSHTRLKGKISSQMGQIFVKFDLFEQAKIRFNDAILYNLDSNDSLALMYNYRNMAEVRVGFYRVAKFTSIHHRHHYVAHNYIDLLFPYDIQCICTIYGSPDVVCLR